MTPRTRIELVFLFAGLLLGAVPLEAHEASASRAAPEVADVIAPAEVPGPAHLRGARYRLTGGDSRDPLLRSRRYTLQAHASYLPAPASDRGD